MNVPNPGKFDGCAKIDIVSMAEMTPEVSKLLERALSLSVDEQEALADSLISNLGCNVDPGVQAA
jgi:hypothetical protein